MFTIRFEEHGKKEYTSCSAARYEVVRHTDSVEVQLWSKLSGTSEASEFVGPQETYAKAYVTNAAGKTIDVIKL